ncbi:MAG TPA: hypothetical protein VE961_22820 [Pyrinomonadaceae bacterium]|nr:hypothetical protein [Pyrinomonadaceae bacterium]
MNDDNYLWDKSGEPDVEVRELEELLGTLKYQPRPLQIPASMTERRQRIFIPLTIAAAIALLVIGAGLLIHFANSKAGVIQQAKQDPQVVPAPQEIAPEKLLAAAPAEEHPAPTAPAPHKVHRMLIARNSPRRTAPAVPAFTEQELAQREQVLVALRLVTTKLNFAQRKAQGLPQINSTRNQHKTG